MGAQLYYGGTVLTMKAEGDTAEALVAEDGKIVFVGSLEAAEAFCRENAIEPYLEKINLQKKTLMPAFIDPHGHISMVARYTAWADLSECESFDEIVEKLRQYKEKTKPGPEGMIMGFGYDHNFLAEGRYPDKTVLDRVSEEIPVFILHTSSHMGAGNSALLRLAGIDENTPDPQGARFGRMADGREPDGYVEEVGALRLVLSFAIPRLHMNLSEHVEEAQEMYLKNGITTCQDGAATREETAFWAQAAREGRLQLDVVSYPVLEEDTGELLKEYRDCDGRYQGRFKIGGVKIVLDGSPQGRTAWLSRPYEPVDEEGQDADYCGYPAKTDEEAEKLVRRAVEMGKQLLAHCNGDAAAEQFLDAYEKALKESRRADREALRPVMIHCQTVRYDQLDRMAELSMIPSMFVAHTYYWGDIHLKNLGPERGSRISPARSAFDRGLRVNFHQDPLVVQPKMLHTVWCAVNRITRGGVSIGAAERVSVFEALQAVTINGAYAYFEEDKKGTLEPGKLADMVILSDNPMTVDPMELDKIRVLVTLKEGEVRYRGEL